MIMDRCYVYEANYFYNRLSMRGETPKYKNTFIQQSKKYLIDETVAAAIMNAKMPNNNLNVYYYGKTPTHIITFTGKNARKDYKLHNYLYNTKALYGLTKCRLTSLREK